ncbi:MAG: metallophosphoesterase family protein [Oscillospiraceae bacterium]|nr:metallophosphoesterase family protein [Oscillospiraceae bacterium]
MKIMAMSDVESKSLWDFYKKGKLSGVDLIISCGDLHPEYLSFIETVSNMPLLYVHGNHDEKYAKHPPEGCECIEDRVYVHNGIRILGLGGSMRYRPGLHQYTEQDMQRRIRKLWLKLRRTRGFDILVTHAPAKGFHDGDDLCHQGFEAFLPLIEQYQPKYFIHGHMHMDYGLKTPRVSQLGSTTVINAYDTFRFDYETGIICPAGNCLDCPAREECLKSKTENRIGCISERFRETQAAENSA